MKKNTLIFRLCSFAAAVFFAVSCSVVNPPAARTHTLTLMSYNAQTFFDTVEDGTEFSDFKGSNSRWSAQKYRKRLKRLEETLYAMGGKLSETRIMPDIVVLQEIENERVLEDFCKQLPQKDSYPYVLCSPAHENAAFTTAVLSKYPIEDYRIHTLQTVSSVYASVLRPLTEVVINTGGNNGKNLIKIFSVHWKSKRGTANGQRIRTLQEEQLVQKISSSIKHSSVPVIACGDFNQEYDAFNNMRQFSVCWDNYRNQQLSGVQDSGTYYFRGKWLKIDHIFYINAASFANGIAVEKFVLHHDEPLIHKGIPHRYNVRTGQGYSDHLPIGIRFSIP